MCQQIMSVYLLQRIFFQAEDVQFPVVYEWSKCPSSRVLMVELYIYDH